MTKHEGLKCFFIHADAYLGSHCPHHIFMWEIISNKTTFYHHSTFHFFQTRNRWIESLFMLLFITSLNTQLSLGYYLNKNFGIPVRQPQEAHGLLLLLLFYGSKIALLNLFIFFFFLCTTYMLPALDYVRCTYAFSLY